MTEFGYESFPELLRKQVPGFDRVYDEHVHDYDEVLPHVLLGDLVRFLSDQVREKGAQSAALHEAMSLMEGGMGSADPSLQELVAVSFLENLDPADESFPAIRKLFGPHLEEQYQKYEERPE